LGSPENLKTPCGPRGLGGTYNLPGLFGANLGDLSQGECNTGGGPGALKSGEGPLAGGDRTPRGKGAPLGGGGGLGNPRDPWVGEEGDFWGPREGVQSPGWTVFGGPTLWGGFANRPVWVGNHGFWVGGGAQTGPKKVIGKNRGQRGARGHYTTGRGGGGKKRGVWGAPTVSPRRDRLKKRSRGDQQTGPGAKPWAPRMGGNRGGKNGGETPLGEQRGHSPRVYGDNMEGGGEKNRAQGGSPPPGGRRRN